MTILPPVSKRGLADFCFFLVLKNSACQQAFLSHENSGIHPAMSLSVWLLFVFQTTANRILVLLCPKFINDAIFILTHLTLVQMHCPESQF